MLQIKPYDPKWKDDLEFVCLNTAYDTAFEPKERNYLLNTYCDYYLEAEGAHCFAAVDEADKGQGYILCAPDYRRFRKSVKPYVMQAAKSGLDHALEGVGERLATGLFSPGYPAHLHININPDYQHQGVGTRLMDTLIAHLRENNVKGVMLITGAGNKKAIAFYKKYGFHRIVRFGPAMIMGMKLQ